MADVTEGPGSAAASLAPWVHAEIDRYFEDYRPPSGDIQRFKERCEDLLDVATLTDEERDAASARIAELAAAFDPIDSKRFELAQQICRETAKALRESRKVVRILETWPAPIANELAAMLLRLEGRGSAPSPEGAMVQLRDLSEVLLRLPVIALGRMMIARGGDGARHARRALLEASAGNWARSARTIAGKVRAEREGVPEPYHRLATIMDDPKHPFHKSVMDGLIAARNAYIGHGATQSDPVETASLIRWFIDPEAPEPQDHEVLAMREAPLLSALAAAVDDGMWDGIELSVLLPDESSQPLRGAMALDAWAVQPHRHDPEGPVLKVLLACGSDVVSLEPFLSARRCGRCGKNDFFLFDSMRSWEQVALIDYARGHPDRLKVKGSDFATDVEALRSWVDDVILEDADGLDSEKIFARLESLGIERRYRRPTFLRDQLRAFLKDHSRGVFWLRAPAHVGKSTFVLGLTNASVDKEHLTEKEFVPGPGNGNRIASFICRREYKSSPVNFLNGLKADLVRALDIPSASSDSLPEVSDVLRQSESPRAAFVTFVEALRRIARPGRLLIVIDGLDEAQPGDNRLGIPDLVPAAADLPEGVYVLLTSRRPGDPGCPPRLADALRPVFGEALDPASCPDGTRIIEIDTESTNGPYRQLLREFVCANIAGDRESTERLADRIIEISDGRFHNVAFLTAQLAGGRIARDTLERGDAGGLRPDSIHADFLDNLDNRYGPKIADRMRRVLAALCAAEAAQDWHFTEGAEPDLATVGAEDLNAWLASVLAGENPPPPPGAAILEPFGREWHGIPVEILAEAAHMDRPPDRHGRRYGAILLETLALLQGTLDVWRGDERDALWRIGLKELRPVLEDREDFRGPLADAHALFAAAAFEAMEAFLASGDGVALERWVARAPRLEGHVELSGAETAAHRFARPDVLEAISRVADATQRSDRLSARIA